eukprot:TRINITY_DN9691_c0_g1_i1.p1 TRINITY_DN9691_c0_g1~~TRINITY_DN9691_c0_g1_i1.p1  ORF type:complete len:165 (-),score=29.46 TRINITY_DN9691_c0_g1_i1:37-495(-)
MKVLLLTIMLSFVITDPAPDPRDIHLHFHKGAGGYGETEVGIQSPCVEVPGMVVSCVRKSGWSCWREAYAYNTMTKQECEDDCLRSERNPGLPCVFYNFWQMGNLTLCDPFHTTLKKDKVVKVCKMANVTSSYSRCTKGKLPVVSFHDAYKM